MAKKQPAKLPTFTTEAEEREFWESHDTADYVDWSKARRATFPDLRPSTAETPLSDRADPEASRNPS